MSITLRLNGVVFSYFVVVLLLQLIPLCWCAIINSIGHCFGGFATGRRSLVVDDKACEGGGAKGRRSLAQRC